MAKRTTLVTGVSAGVTVCSLIVACSSTSSSTQSSDPTPPGTTPVASAPYAVCATLEPGSFTVNGGGSYTVPATTLCDPAGTPTGGSADAHCAGVTPQTVNGASCSIGDAGPASSEDAGPAASADAAAPPGDAATPSSDAGTPSEDAGAVPTPGPCDENGIDGAYGSTMYGTEGDDDDCKYHVSYTASPICENSGTYFVVNATYLTQNGAPLANASAFAEVCLSDTHPAPPIDARPPTGSQQVVEGPPGTYTIGPVQFDAPGDWTVRFHFNEFCCDVAADSPHGHAAFHVTVP